MSFAFMVNRYGLKRLTKSKFDACCICKNVSFWIQGLATGNSIPVASGVKNADKPRRPVA
jgi:hypothetical protein